jgi:hypothetical protein
MTTVNISSAINTVTITEDNGGTSVVLVPITSTITAVTPGPQGPSGDIASGYHFTQSTASSTWTINHNLGYIPGVEVLDSGSQEIEADVSHLTINTTVIMFTLPTTGFARLI